MADHRADNTGGGLSTIQARLYAAQVPRECSWTVEEAKSSRFFAKIQRGFMIANLSEFS